MTDKEDRRSKQRQIEELRLKLGFKIPDLTILRVPKSTLEKFKEIANSDDFAGDYGFLLKHLLDFYIGLLPTGTEHIELQIEALRQEIEKLKVQPKPEEPQRKTLSGRVINPIRP